MALWIALAGCGGPDPSTDLAPADATSTGYDATSVPEAGCTSRVEVPGAFGIPDGTEPDRDAAVFGPDPTPFQVRLGMPSSDPSNSVSFLWRTDVDTLATVVEYAVDDGADGPLDQRATGASFRFGGTLTEPGPNRIHEIKLCTGLVPATTYRYRVGGDGHWSPTYTFTTPGAPDAFSTFRIAVAGDTRGAYETWAAVLATIDTYDPDLVLFTGDMVDLGAIQSQWDGWFDAGGELLTHLRVVPAHGNHEFLATQYFAQWSLPDNEQWFHVRFGTMELAVLNDTVVDDDAIDTQAAWMADVFASSTATWKVGLHHRGAYAACTNHGSNLDARAAWSPVWDAAGAQLVFAGHNHVYERSVPIRADAEAAPGAGTVYVVSGGAGADLYSSFDDAWFTAVAQSTENFVIADFSATEVEVTVRDLAENVIDAFVVPVGPAR
ncbi:MAG: metallophosphoesterase [Myxococcota bacterium]